MSFYIFVSIVFAVTTKAASTSHLDPLSDQFIHHINSNQSLWRAGRNFHRDKPLIHFKRLMGSLKDNAVYRLPHKRYEILPRRIPRYFDAREHWSNCPTLRQIRDQGSCGSCWAVSAASAMTDRVCVNSNGTKHFYYSEEDVLSCCTNCGAGCDGGILSAAWIYTEKVGTVSGGSYQSQQGCQPYEVPPCKHDVAGNKPPCGYVLTPKCKKVCQNSYKKRYLQDKRKIGEVYVLTTELDIKLDILKYGPVTSSFTMYEDFLHYKSGIYKKNSGTPLGDHAIKLLGWGNEKGVKYWLAANSWNTDWGDGGFFKILMGYNKGQINKYAVAGYIVSDV